MVLLPAVGVGRSVGRGDFPALLLPGQNAALCRRLVFQVSRFTHRQE
jgi:hypothetical protein